MLPYPHLWRSAFIEIFSDLAVLLEVLFLPVSSANPVLERVNAALANVARR